MLQPLCVVMCFEAVAVHGFSTAYTCISRCNEPDHIFKTMAQTHSSLCSVSHQ